MPSLSFDLSGDLGGDAPTLEDDSGLSNFERVLQLLSGPAQDWENTAIAVRDEGVDTAVGVNLENKYGKNVGLRRNASPLFSTDDDTYRRAIQAQIQTNRSPGKREQLIKIARLILSDSTAQIAIRRSGTASLLVQIYIAAVASPTETLLTQYLTAAASNGVRVSVSSFAAGSATGFLMGSGLGLGDTRSSGGAAKLADYRSIDS